MTPSAAAALRYLELGFNPLPIAPGAHEPLVKWKYLQTTRTTEAEIRDWYRRWPSAGVGVVCGKISGIVVLDSDPRNGPGLDLDYGPSCPTVATPGGGSHRYFAYGPVRSTHPLVPGLDVQSDRTYVIAPPSRRNGKVYAFVDDTARHLVEPPLLPTAIVERLIAHHAHTPPEPRDTIPRLNGHLAPTHVDLDTALRVLEEVHGVKIRKVGPLQWMAGCPLHDDRKPSLAVSVGDEGRLLLHCHAGCSFADLLVHLAAVAVSA